MQKSHCYPSLQNTKHNSLGVQTALGVLWFYKNGISPLLPKSCRFIPTCSSYSVEAYQDFGFWKGSVLTTWRVLRCNPLSKGGFDPPQWPPIGCTGLLGRSASRTDYKMGLCTTWALDNVLI